jgi:hypothetical protein
MKTLLQICLFLILITTNAIGTTVNLSATTDSYLYKSSSTENYGAYSELYSYSWAAANMTQRPVLYFDMTSIPSTATINSATLKLTVVNTGGGAGTKTLEIHKLTRSFTEGTGTTPGSSTSNVSWTNYTGSTAWTSAGGDFNGAVSASTTCSTTVTLNTQLSWTVTTDVANFVATSANNYGWIMTQTDADAMTYFYFGSRTHGTSAYRPELTVDYTVVLPVIFEAVKASFDNFQKKISWTTSAEHDNDFFSIEKTSNFNQIKTIAKINASNKGIEKQQYQYIDSSKEDISDHLYYRIKQVDFDGNSANSNWVKLTTDQSANTHTLPFPNPLIKVIY